MWIKQFGLRSNLLVGIGLGALLSGSAWCLGGKEGPVAQEKKKRGSRLALVC